MESWSFLTSHARVPLRIACDPGARLRDIAASLDITGRTAHGIVTDLTPSRLGDQAERRPPQPLPDPGPPPAARTPTQEPAIGEVLALLAGAGARLRWPGPDQAEATAAERACTHPPQTPGARQPGPASSGHRPLMDPDTGDPARAFPESDASFSTTTTVAPCMADP